MTDIATIGFGVDTKGLVKGVNALDDMDKAGDKATNSIEALDAEFKQISTSIKSFDSSANQAKKANDKFNSSVDKTSVSLNKAAASAGKFNSKVTALYAAIGGLGATALGANMVSMAFNFDDAMNTVQSKLLITSDAMGVLNDKAKELGATTAFSASEVGQGMAFLAQAGLDTGEILEAIAPSLNLAAAAGMDLARSADIATNVMGQFQLEASDLTMITDVLALTSAKANTSVEEMAFAFKQTGSVASTFGVSLQDTSAIIGVLSNNGIKAETAGMAMKNMFARLSGANSEANKLLGKFNLSSASLFDTLKDGTVRFKGVTNLFDQLKDSGMNSVNMLKLFGLEAGPGLLSIKDSAKVIEELKEEISKSGKAAEMAEIRMQGLVGVVKTTKSTWEALNLSLADAGGRDAAIYGLTAITNLMKDMIVEINEVEKEFDLVGEAWKLTTSEMAKSTKDSNDQSTSSFDELSKKISTSIDEYSDKFYGTLKLLPVVYNGSMKAIGKTTESWLLSSKAVFFEFEAAYHDIIATIVRVSSWGFNDIKKIGSGIFSDILMNFSEMLNKLSGIGDIAGLGGIGDAIKQKADSMGMAAAKYAYHADKIKSTDSLLAKKIEIEADASRFFARSLTEQAANAKLSAKNAIDEISRIKKKIKANDELLQRLREIAEAKKGLDKPSTTTNKLGTNKPSAPLSTTNSPLSVTGKSSAGVSKAISEGERLTQSLRTAEEKYNDLKDAAKDLYELGEKKGGISFETYNRALLAAKEEYDRLTKTAVKLTDEQRKVKQLTEQSLTPLQKFNAYQNKINEYVDKHGLSQSSANALIAEARKEYQKNDETLAKQYKSQEERESYRKQLIEETRTALEKYNAEVDKVNKSIADDETKARKLKALKEAYDKNTESIRQNTKEYKESDEAEKYRKQLVEETRTALEKYNAEIEKVKKSTADDETKTRKLKSLKEAYDDYTKSVMENTDEYKEREKQSNAEIAQNKSISETLVDLQLQQRLLNIEKEKGKSAARIEEIFLTTDGISREDAVKQEKYESGIKVSQEALDTRQRGNELLAESNRQLELTKILTTQGSDAAKLKELTNDKVSESIAKQIVENEKQQEQMTSLKTKTEEWQSSFTDAVLSGKEGVIDFFETMILNAIKAQAQMALFGDSSGGAAPTGGIVSAIGGMLGFASGGYTGSMGTNQVAGVVHGQEYVVNASATKEYRPILEAMNSGKSIGTNEQSQAVNINYAPVIQMQSDGQGDDIDLQKVLKENERQIRAIITQELSKGGTNSRLAGMRS